MTDLKATAAVLIGEAADELEFYAAAELQRYLMRLFRLSPAITRNPDFKSECFFVLGSPETNRSVALMTGAEREPLRGQQFVLRKTAHRGCPAMLIAGSAPRAALWGMYELVEAYGVRYLITEDVFPEDAGEFYLPQIDVTMSPVFETRAWRGINVFAMGPESWGLKEYRLHLDQLAKLKFNSYLLNMFTEHPFVHFSIGGRARSSGGVLLGWRMPIQEPYVGKELFGGRAGFWNEEFEDAESYAERIAAGQRLAHGIVEHAKHRGFETALTISLTELPREFRTPENAYAKSEWGNPPDLSKPVTLNNACAVLKAYIDTYPEVDHIELAMSEFRYPVVGAERCWEELDQKYDLNSVMTLDDILEQARNRDSYSGGAERAEREAAGDVEALYYVDKLFNEMNPLQNTSRPDMRLVFSDLSEELSPILHKVLPPGSGVNLAFDYVESAVVRRIKAFEAIPEEIPAIHTLELQDDNIGVVSQLTTDSIEKSLEAMKRSHWKGFLTRLWVARDADPCIAYIAKAA